MKKSGTKYYLSRLSCGWKGQAVFLAATPLRPNPNPTFPRHMPETFTRRVSPSPTTYISGILTQNHSPRPQTNSWTYFNMAMYQQRPRRAIDAKRHFASDFSQSNYPHRLNFYINPPTAEVTLDQFEQWAIDRLRSSFPSPPPPLHPVHQLTWTQRSPG